jgi:polyisoprenoid-binding protein YceI
LRLEIYVNKQLALLVSSLLLASVVFAGCAAPQAPAVAPTATEAPAAEPTATTPPEPNATTAPTETAAPAATTAPSATPAATETPVPTAQPTATQAPPTATSAPATSAPATSAPVAAAAVFQIVPAESEARFKINEVLRGEPKLVIGVTSGVTGQLTVDPANPAATQVGEITVDASSLATDENMRNRAIRSFILDTGRFPNVKFTPTELTGLPATAAVGQVLAFKIAGDLTIRDITKPVVWDVTVTPESETRIKGLATVTIPLADFNLSIPDVPFVANVDDAVVLELDFVAQAGS